MADGLLKKLAMVIPFNLKVHPENLFFLLLLLLLKGVSADVFDGCHVTRV